VTAHLAAPSPDGLRWADAPSGESVPALDAYLAGCIQAFITNHGTLDPERLQVLTECATDLAGLLGSLSEEEAVYVSRLLQATDLITTDDLGELKRVYLVTRVLPTPLGPREILRTRRAAASRGGCPSKADDKGKESTHPFPLSTYSAPGDLRQDPGRAVESPAEARTCGNGSREMRVLLSTYGSRGDVEPMVGLAVRLRALGAEVRVCAPPDEELLVMATRFVTPVQAPCCAQWLQATSDRS